MRTCGSLPVGPHPGGKYGRVPTSPCDPGKIVWATVPELASSLLLLVDSFMVEDEKEDGMLPIEGDRQDQIFTVLSMNLGLFNMIERSL